ncbi:MAG: chromosome segregation ATPase [Waterburya sp.]
MNDAEPDEIIVEQWCLVTVRQWKRESFIKYLHNDIQQKQLQQLIIEVRELDEAVYDNMVLLRITNYPEVRKILQQIEFFQGLQRLKPDEAKRMLQNT